LFFFPPLPAGVEIAATFFCCALTSFIAAFCGGILPVTHEGSNSVLLTVDFILNKAVFLSPFALVTKLEKISALNSSLVSGFAVPRPSAGVQRPMFVLGQKPFLGVVVHFFFQRLIPRQSRLLRFRSVPKICHPPPSFCKVLRLATGFVLPILGD